MIWEDEKFDIYQVKFKLFESWYFEPLSFNRNVFKSKRLIFYGTKTSVVKLIIKFPSLSNDFSLAASVGEKPLVITAFVGEDEFPTFIDDASSSERTLILRL